MLDSALAPRPSRLHPVQIAPETYVIQGIHGEGEGPLAVHMNAMLIRGAEPVLVDTGAPVDREAIIEQLVQLVDPEDVRWIFITHDDIDHYGNLDVLMRMCPRATMVASWYLTRRMSAEGPLPPVDRWRWVGDGEGFDAGDRVLRAVRPPLYDSPTTRGLLDPTTGVYWASDCFSTPVPRATAFVDELDPDEWASGFTTFQKWNSPWVELVDGPRYHAEVERLRALGMRTIATCHGPTIGPAFVDQAFELMHAVPAAQVPPQPGQPVLDEIVSSMMAAAQSS
jgi:flavorubredoxin